MKRHALVIGSQTGVLRGVHHDVDAITRTLARWELEVTRCIEGDATRAGILDAYRALIGRAGPDDTVVLYYSGHGGFAQHPSGRRLQYLVPTDWVDDEQVFHGITDLELSSLLAELTARTVNTTVILDCCHAALLSKGEGLVPRVLPGRWTPGLARHVADHAPARVHAIGNPHAVRLVATEADREAFEANHLIDGVLVPRGLFTCALQGVLDEPGATALSWRDIRDRVREQVLARAGSQRPSVEGPADRVVFTTTELTRTGAAVYFEHDGAAALRTSRALGARVGAVYDIVRRGAHAVAPDTIAATATITALHATGALVALTDVHEPPQLGALAFPRVSPFPAVRCRLIGEPDAGLRARLAQSPLIELADPARFELEIRGLDLLLTDRGGAVPSTTRQANTRSGHDAVARRLERWARAEALRELPPGGLPATAIELSWGRVVDGELVPSSPGDGARVGDDICVRAKNAFTRPLYLWMFDLGVEGDVTLVSGCDEGQRIQPGDTLALGEDDGVVTGLTLCWPDELGRTDGPRRESIVVLAADHWADVTVFETPGRPRARGTPGALEDLLHALANGAPRDLRARPVPQRYTVARVDFDLDPTMR